MTVDSWAPEAAAFLGSDLTRSFGGVEFRITPSPAFGADRIEVSWTDGPPLYAVDVVVGRSACRFELDYWGAQTCLVAGIVSKRRTMSQEAEDHILSLIATALGTDDLDPEQLHPTPPLLALPGARFTEGTVPEFLDMIFEKTSFCTQCPAPAMGGTVGCPCIIVRNSPA